MKRAAQEKSRTYRTWRKHHDRHVEQARIGLGNPVPCRCDGQPGRFRKGQRAYSCGKVRCWLCHYDKLVGNPTIADLRRLDDFRIGLTELA